MSTSITQNLAALLNATAAQATTASADKKPAPMLYLNVGYDHPTLGRINLPFNLSLDTMANKDMSGTEEWKVKSTLSNMLLEELRKLVQGLPQGESKVINGLTIEAYKRKDANVTPNADLLSQALAARPTFG